MKPMHDLPSRNVGFSSVIKLQVIILKGKEDETKTFSRNANTHGSNMTV
jgi:hypothetical protein